MMIFEFSSIVWGFLWHFFGRVTCSMKNYGLANLTDYVAGVTITAPVFNVALRKTGKFNEQQIFTATCVFLFSFVLVGLGTALGWLTFPHPERKVIE